MTGEKCVDQFSLQPDQHQSGPRSHFQTHHGYLAPGLHRLSTLTLSYRKAQHIWAQNH